MSCLQFDELHSPPSPSLAQFKVVEEREGEMLDAFYNSLTSQATFYRGMLKSGLSLSLPVPIYAKNHLWRTFGLYQRGNEARVRGS